MDTMSSAGLFRSNTLSVPHRIRGSSMAKLMKFGWRMTPHITT